MGGCTSGSTQRCARALRNTREDSDRQREGNLLEELRTSGTIEQQKDAVKDFSLIVLTHRDVFIGNSTDSGP